MRLCGCSTTSSGRSRRCRRADRRRRSRRAGAGRARATPRGSPWGHAPATAATARTAATAATARTAATAPHGRRGPHGRHGPHGGHRRGATSVPTSGGRPAQRRLERAAPPLSTRPARFGPFRCPLERPWRRASKGRGGRPGSRPRGSPWATTVTAATAVGPPAFQWATEGPLSGVWNGRRPHSAPDRPDSDRSGVGWNAPGAKRAAASGRRGPAAVSPPRRRTRCRRA